MNRTEQMVLYFLLMMLAFVGYSQNSDYYYYKGQRIPLTLDKRYINISTTTDFQETSANSIDLNPFVAKAESSTTQKWAKLEFSTTLSDIDYIGKINDLKNNPSITTVEPSFLDETGEKLGMSNYLYVKLKNTSDIEVLRNLSESKNVEIVEQNQFMPLWYTLKCTKNTLENTLAIANYFYETGLFESSSPDFLSENNEESLTSTNPTTVANTTTFCTNEPLFGQQWGLENNSGSGPVSGVMPTNTFNFDINACAAWSISKGTDVKVAVIDTGIDLNNQDLQDNLSPLSYDTENPASPNSNVCTNCSIPNHGTAVAGVIGARQNNYQISGVAPECKLMSISSCLHLDVPSIGSQLVNGINWAWNNGAAVINCSWRLKYQNDMVEEAINIALTQGRNGLGCVVVFISGNNDVHPYHGVKSFAVKYPANINPGILVVGATSSNGNRWSDSCYGPTLDVVAPGDDILYTDLNNEINYSSGTSLAAPHVSGIAALILKVNPTLTGKQVCDIIEKTCQKVGMCTDALGNIIQCDYAPTAGRPNGTWTGQMGHGLVNAYAAVQLAQTMLATSFDLMIKDGADDLGIQPNPTTQPLWNSPDIWVRNYQDGNTTHQNPIYRNYAPLLLPNYVYVRVANKGSIPSTGLEKLKLYYSLDRLWFSWPSVYWKPILLPNQTEITIPQLNPGQETVLSIPWIVPFPPSDSGTVNDNKRFSLLARIESSTDTMIAETGVIPSGYTQAPNTRLRFITNVRNNNNIAWKNSIKVDFESFPTVITLDNSTDEPQNYYLELVKEDSETGKPIYEEAEVNLKMDDVLFAAWERGGKIAQQLKATPDLKAKIVNGNNVILDNIILNPNETGTLNLNFNFLTKELTDKTKYEYQIIQRDKETGEIIGGETITICKQPRPIFIADAGGTKDVDRNEPIIISASQINEAAIYNWYDAQGQLIYQGKDLSIATEVATKYKLEVIAAADGFKDYAEVTVNLKPSSLAILSPNPASNSVNITYKLNEVNSAYLMIIGGYATTNTSNNYILDLNSSETTINLSEYPSGFYTVALVCNGQIVDAKTLLKN
jgi:subtilisin family serine protease